MRGRRRRDRSAVHPGVIDTPIWTKILGSTGRNVPIGLNEVAKAGVPLGRVGAGQDATGRLPGAAAARACCPAATAEQYRGAGSALEGTGATPRCCRGSGLRHRDGGLIATAAPLYSVT